MKFGYSVSNFYLGKELSSSSLSLATTSTFSNFSSITAKPSSILSHTLTNKSSALSSCISSFYN